MKKKSKSCEMIFDLSCRLGTHDKAPTRDDSVDVLAEYRIPGGLR